MKIKIVTDEGSFIYDATIKDIDKGLMICYNEEDNVLNTLTCIDDLIIYDKKGPVNLHFVFDPKGMTEGTLEMNGFTLHAEILTKNIIKMDGIISINYDIILEERQNKEIIIYY